MNGFLHHSRKPEPSVRDFYFEAAYGTRESQKAITAMANEIASALAPVPAMLTDILTTGKTTLRVLRKSTTICTVEDERKLVSNYEDVEHAMIEVYDQMLDAENSAVCDQDLFGKNESAVIDAFTAVIKKLKELIQVTQDIRWAIMDHTEDHGVIKGDPMTGDELIKSLG